MIKPFLCGGEYGSGMQDVTGHRSARQCKVF
jgi:hypothetical protein